MRFPDELLTNAEVLTPAMSIKTQEKADEYFEALVDYHVRMFGGTREEAIEKEKSNLGYWAGYFDNATIKRVNKLFCTTHPILGDIVPTIKEAYERGREDGIEEVE